MAEDVVLPDDLTVRAEVLISTTWACNLKCTYCFIEDAQISGNGHSMSPELAVKVIDALTGGLKEFDCISLHFYGGEPLVNLPAMKSMIDRVEERNLNRFKFVITTNGVNHSNEAINILKKGNFDIVLSIDGPEHVHNQARRTRDGKPTHNDVIRFLERIRNETSCRVRGSAVVRSGWSLSEATSYLKTLPVDVIKAQAVRSATETPYTLNADENIQYLKDLEQIGEEVIDNLKEGRMQLDDRFSNRVLQLLEGSERTSFCGAGKTTFGITPDGTVVPCILMGVEAEKLGHIQDKNFSWKKAGERWKNNYRNTRSACKSCSALPLCGGGCPVMVPICGENECDITRKDCEIATKIFNTFKNQPEQLLLLAGIR